MMSFEIKFLHLVAVMLVSGLLVANYGLIILAVRRDQLRLVARLSFSFDIIIVVGLVLLALSGFFLVHPKGFQYSTPWIEMAFILTVFLLLLVLLNAFLKKFYLMKQKVLDVRFKLLVLLHAVNLVMFILVMLIVHDAVTKASFFIG